MNSYVKSPSTSMGDCISQKPQAPAKACSCGGKGCAICGGTGYVRPSFFAGQLLTEEDLQSLSDYVVAKNRLHNRHFFGEGVVCGLDVTCEPCGGGKVVVAPGYALDCCGNDIVLNCPTPLDINAMIRELRIDTLGGYDCGDPCVETKTGDRTQEKKSDKGGDKKPAHRYCLYVRYCEEETDPVIAYGTDEPCVPPGCEPTRVREGVRFELRCPEEERGADDVLVHIRRCFEDLMGAETTAVEATWHRTYACRIAGAKEAIKESPTPSFGDKQVATLNEATTKLEAATKELGTALSNAARAEPSKEKPGEPAISRLSALQDLLEATLEGTGVVGSFLSRERTEQEDLLSNLSGLRGALSSFNEQFESAAKSSQTQIEQILPARLDLAYATALFDIGRYAAGLIPPEGAHEVPANTQRVDAIALRYLAEKVVLNHDLLSQAGQSTNALRDWLLCRLDKTTCLTDCALREEVTSIVLPPPRANAIGGDATTYSNATVKLLEALFRYLRECVCCALNPPCPPCDDAAVLLACLEVRDCKVISICNLERTFVLTPLALRYWLSPLNLLGEAFEALCCKPIHLECRHAMFQPESQDIPSTYYSSSPAVRYVPSNVVGKLFGLRNPDDAHSLTNTLAALWGLMRAEGMASGITKVGLYTAEVGTKAIVARGEQIAPFAEEAAEIWAQVEDLRRRISKLEAPSARRGRQP